MMEDVSRTSLIGLQPFQLVAIILAVMTPLILADAWAGHYRSGFKSRAQYMPFISGGLFIFSILAATLSPGIQWMNRSLYTVGWLVVISGLIGSGFHHYYGIASKPGGYKWLPHYLMYGAPQLAPLALAAMGAMGLIVAKGLAGEERIAGMRLSVALLGFVAFALIGAVLQSGILHYRGAFNNVLMYAPMTAPLLAIPMCLWVICAPSNTSRVTLTILLWMTLVIGFVGLGMHLRGFDRQMGGLHIPVFNLLEGPPALAPAAFAGFAAVGLVAIQLL